MSLSLRAYARRRNVSHTAVQKAVQAGRITLQPDGSIDPDQADAQWAESTRAYSFQGSQATPSMSTTADKPQVSQDTYLQARATNEILKVQRQKLKLQAERDELIDRKTVVDQVLRLGRIERDAWLQWPARIASELAATLSIDAHTLHIELEKYVKKHLTQLATIAYVDEPKAPSEDRQENDTAMENNTRRNASPQESDDDDLDL